jgi:hypothetical protein
MRLSFRPLAALCLVLPGLACGSDEQGPNAAHDDSSELPVAVVEGSLRPPGTLLAPAVEVQAGSLLVGRPSP